MPKQALTAKQKRFVQEYLIDLNATQAAIRAGYSEHTAKDIGCQNLAKLNIANALAAAAKKASEKANVSTQDVLKGLYKEATREGEGASHGARVSAWGLLGKYHKMFTDRIEADVSVDVSITDARGKLESLITGHVAAAKNREGTE